ncbi:hypothetical protein ACEWY4_001265 [Coilia grayii]|uniref:Integrase catalytic domain-containing protein n=1 Tax=Coilia grayii TaxID=363190 RepID=A0ABD1KZ04_9TELE
MYKDIKEWCRRCERCTLARPDLSGKAPMGHLVAAKPNQVLALDFTLLEMARDGKEHVLVMTDVFSKFTQAVATSDQSASTVAGIVVREWFYKFGIPARIHSDQGRIFESALVHQLYGITKTRTTPYHPQGNAQYHRGVPLSTDVRAGAQSGSRLPVGKGPGSDWVLEHRGRLQVAFEGARDRIELATRLRQERHDQKISDHPLAEGQVVYLRNTSVRGRSKIQDAWSPTRYVVLKVPTPGGCVYSIAPQGQPDAVRHVHRSMLKAVWPPVITGWLAPALSSQGGTQPEGPDEESGHWVAWRLHSEGAPPPPMGTEVAPEPWCPSEIDCSVHWWWASV